MTNNPAEEMKQFQVKLQEKKVIIGTERVLKALKDRKLYRVFIAKNCPATTKKDLQYYAGLAEIPVLELEMSNEELGIFCKKNYFVSVVGTIGE
jgi:large subunit ribosomal protein L30e